MVRPSNMFMDSEIEKLKPRQVLDYGFVKVVDYMGVARELARLVLPLTVYTQRYWKIDLHNLLKFLVQRTDEHAQWEIRQYADVIERIVEGWLPGTFLAYKKHWKK